MSAQDFLEAAKRRRAELDSEIEGRVTAMTQLLSEAEEWRKEAQAALDAAEACETKRKTLGAECDVLLEEGDVIDRVCGLTARTLPTPKVTTSPPVVEAPKAPETVTRITVQRGIGDYTSVRYDASDPVATALVEAMLPPVEDVERPTDGFYEGEEASPRTIPEESINAAAMRMLEEHPGRFITPGQAAEYLFRDHDEWRVHLTLRRLTRMVEKLYANRAATGEIREHRLEKGRGEVAYQARRREPHRIPEAPPVVTTPMSHKKRGEKGGAARWEGVSKEDRSKQASAMAAARWAKRKETQS